MYNETNSTIYTNWALTEPNNNRSNELCSVGNWTLLNGTLETWGWTDVQCQQRLPAICKLAKPYDGRMNTSCCGSTYTIHTQPRTQAEAEELCK